MTISTSSYIFECCCGERYNNVLSASYCKKCRNYSVWGYTKYVVNTETEEVVYGVMPTDEEYAAAEAAASKRWVEEAREFEEMKRAFDAEQAWLEEVARRGEEHAAKEAAEAEEDRLWEVQENLMK